MPHRFLADVVMVAHFGYLVYLVVGGFLAWRWSGGHLPPLLAVSWALGIVFVGFPCPLASIEHRLGHEAGEFGFLDRYLEGIVYPEELTTVLRLVLAILVAVAYWGWLRRRGLHFDPV